jgi:uncharacterized protein YecT (DUF1311 family)
LPARADAPDPKDAATIDACLAALDKRSVGQEIDETTCLLKVANPCIGGDAASVSDGKQIGCFDRERLVWDTIINDSYKTMMNGLDPEQATKLRDMQRAWIHVRDLAFLKEAAPIVVEDAQPMASEARPRPGRR